MNEARTDEPRMRAIQPEPTEPGWYAYSGGAQSMIFLMTDKTYLGAPGPRWWAVFDNGSIAGVAWGYIEQALGVWDLVRLVPDRDHVANEPVKDVFHSRDCRERLDGEHRGCYVIATGEPL